jgi:peptidoglycan hydrolase CwlO-like protein
MTLVLFNKAMRAIVTTSRQAGTIEVVSRSDEFKDAVEKVGLIPEEILVRNGSR